MNVTLTDFKQLLHVLREQNIGIKVKTQAGWTNGFLNIIGFIASTVDQERKTFGGVVLSNATETEGVLINNIASITSFQIMEQCNGFEPGKVYDLQDTVIKAAIIK